MLRTNIRCSAAWYDLSRSPKAEKKKTKSKLVNKQVSGGGAKEVTVSEVATAASVGPAVVDPAFEKRTKSKMVNEQVSCHRAKEVTVSTVATAAAVGGPVVVATTTGGDVAVGDAAIDSISEVIDSDAKKN